VVQIGKVVCFKDEKFVAYELMHCADVGGMIETMTEWNKPAKHHSRPEDGSVKRRHIECIRDAFNVICEEVGFDDEIPHK
jgi:hypothetical protein